MVQIWQNTVEVGEGASAQLMLGAQGLHVAKVQSALFALDCYIHCGSDLLIGMLLVMRYLF
jgi:hypothetical protein